MGHFRQIVIESQSKCSYEGGYLVVNDGISSRRVHLSEISSIVFVPPASYISSQLLTKLVESEITTIFCDDKHLPAGVALPLRGLYDIGQKVSTQFQWTQPRKKEIWKLIVRHKISRQADVLEATDHTETALVLRQYAKEVRSDDATGREAVAASLYFEALFGPEFSRDNGCLAVNHCLNYGYAIILARMATAIAGLGYVPALGVHHHSATNPWNLACDLMEPFRPIVDRIVFESMFEQLDTSAKHRLVDILNQRVLYRESEMKVDNVIVSYARNCLDAMNHSQRPTQSKVPCYEFRSK